jgi:hypothetical protein
VIITWLIIGVVAIVCIAALSTGSNDTYLKVPTPTVSASPQDAAERDRLLTAEAQAQADYTAAVKAAERANDVAAVGQTWVYENGLHVTINSLKRTKITQYVRSEYPDMDGVLISITIENGSDDVFDTSALTTDVQYGTDGTIADQVFDSANNKNADGFTGTVRTGKKITATVEFAIPKKTTDIDIAISPDFNTDAAQFTGRVK